MSFEAAALVLAWVAITILAFAMAGLLRSVRLLAAGRVPQPLQGGPVIGSTLPELAILPGTAEPPVTAALFADVLCDSCQSVLAEFNQLAARGDAVRFVVMLRGEANGFDGSSVTVHESQAAAFDRLQIPLIPFVVGLDRNGTVLDATPAGSPERLGMFVARLSGRG